MSHRALGFCDTQGASALDRRRRLFWFSVDLFSLAARAIQIVSDWRMSLLRSPLQLRSSARKTPTNELARGAESSLLKKGSGPQEKDGVVDGGATSNDDSVARQAGPEGRDERKIHKLDVNAYKPWGSRSRSPSDAGSDTAFCKGGPGKETCGEPVRNADQGVLCDKCGAWFHAGCQNIPKPAYEALVLYEVLSWFCPECKKSLKHSDSARLVSLESKVEQLDKSFQEHFKAVSQSMKEHEKSVENQTKMIERSFSEIRSQKSSYADMVKGTCSEVIEKVSAKISSIPETSTAPSDPSSMPGIVKVFDEFIDKDRRKNNLVIHNLPEMAEGALEERSARDVRMFQEVVKDSFKLNVAIARSFRVGKAMGNRERLLIVTLETPGVKQELLRMAPRLRSSDKWGNIYITPDLTRAEREAARKVREELAVRRNAGETNLTIRKGRIVPVGTVVLSRPDTAPNYPASASSRGEGSGGSGGTRDTDPGNASAPGTGARPKQSTGHQGSSQP